MEYIDAKVLAEKAEEFYNEKRNKDLEQLFGKYLKRTYDMKVWNLYVQYVRNVSARKVNPADVYAFVLSHLEHCYERAPFVKEYISELQSAEEDLLKVEKMRKVYHRALSIPMHEMNQLRAEYEKWETEVNKQSSRTYIDQIQPTYTNAYVVYQRLLPHIKNNDYCRVLDVELGNPLRLPQKGYLARLSFMFKYYEYKFPKSEDLRFLHSFYLEDSAIPNLGTFPAPDSHGISCLAEIPSFLSVWYSFLYKKNVFNFDNDSDYELVLINYLEWTLKTKGANALKGKLHQVLSDEENKKRCGPHLYVYAAEKKFLNGAGNQEEAYRVFSETVERYPNNSFVAEALFDLFSRIDTDGNIILYFKKLKKTSQLWGRMAEYMLKNGSIEEYKEVLTEWKEADHQGEILPAVSTELYNPMSSGTRGVYENAAANFGFRGLSFGRPDPLKALLKRLPLLSNNDNILCSIDLQKVVDILKAI